MSQTPSELFDADDYTRGRRSSSRSPTKNTEGAPTFFPPDENVVEQTSSIELATGAAGSAPLPPLHGVQH